MQRRHWFDLFGRRGSRRDFLRVGASAADLIEMSLLGDAQRRAGENAHVDFYDARRGYVHCSVAPDRWTVRYRPVPLVERPGGPVETLATFVVEDGRPGAVRG